MNRLYGLLIGLVCFSSCVHSRYFTFQVQEIGATLVLEENNSDTQRVFMCNKPSITDYDSLLKHSTEILLKKNTTGDLTLEVLFSSESSNLFIFFNNQKGLSLVPYNSFVLNKDIRENGRLDDQPYVELSFPLRYNNLIKYERPVGRTTICQAKDSTILVESIFNKYAQDRGLARKYLDKLPLYFTKEQLKERSPQVEVEPLEEGCGFKYCGIRVETDVPAGEWGELSFYIDPLLPSYLFQDNINYNNKGSVRVFGQDVCLVETDMFLGCPGIRVVVNNRGVYIKAQD